MITVLAGGVGAARLLRGAILTVSPSEIRAVVNTADDTVLHGLHVSPDLDTVVYTVAGAIDPERGWGLVDETWRTMENLGRYESVRPANSSAAPTWFNLGDRDMATHLYRTARLAEGATLSEVTTEIARAWGLDMSVVPMTDDPVRTLVDVVDDDGVERTVAFQEYFVRRRHSVPVRGIRFDGAATARPTFVELLDQGSRIVIAPSNPIVSIGPLRALRGVDEALIRNRERVVAVSPIVAGAALKGPADRMLTDLGHESSVVGVARLYAPVCGTLVIDRQDADLASAVESLGMRCIVADTIMRSPRVAADLFRTIVSSTEDPR
ncbi:MAG: 2-phospho-L-lactate transferase [Ilumatobacteraceae bacterium]